MRFFTACKELGGGWLSCGLWFRSGHSSSTILLSVQEEGLRAMRASIVLWMSISKTSVSIFDHIPSMSQSEDSPSKETLLYHLPFQSYLFYTLTKRKGGHSFHLFLPRKEETEILQLVVRKGMTNYYGEFL